MNLESNRFLLRWSVGSLLFLLSWAVLMGPWVYVKHLVSGPRLPFTAAYFGSIALTLYFAVGVSTVFLDLFIDSLPSFPLHRLASFQTKPAASPTGVCASDGSAVSFVGIMSNDFIAVQPCTCSTFYLARVPLAMHTCGGMTSPWHLNGHLVDCADASRDVSAGVQHGCMYG